LTGKHKLQDRWNPLPYIVVKKLPDLPVYRLKPERGMGGIRTLHRDHLLTIGESVRLPIPEESKQTPHRPVTSTQTNQKRVRKETRKEEVQEMNAEDGFEGSSSDEEHNGSYFPLRDDVSELFRSIPSAVPEREILPESTPVSDDVKQSLPQEVGEVGETPVEDDTGTSPQPDPVDASESEGGEPPAECEVGEDEVPVEELTCERRPKRQIKPVTRFTYDKPGKPVDKPLNVVHVTRETEKRKSKTVWCHPMAQCFRCSLANPCPERRGLKAALSKTGNFL